MAPERFGLTRCSIVKRAVTRRRLQWSLNAMLLPFFVLAILTGFFGTPAGNRNFGIVVVWIVRWALLMLIFVPFAGRLWRAVCPIPASGEWHHRRAFIGTRLGHRLYTLGLNWPRRLNNIRVVRLRISATDVVHRFEVPAFGIKVNEILPGHVQEVEFTASKAGRFRFACTRWCSTDHWRMRGVIEVVDPQDTAAVPATQN